MCNINSNNKTNQIGEMKMNDLKLKTVETNEIDWHVFIEDFTIIGDGAMTHKLLPIVNEEVHEFILEVLQHTEMFKGISLYLEKTLNSLEAKQIEGVRKKSCGLEELKKSNKIAYFMSEVLKRYRFGVNTGNSYASQTLKLSFPGEDRTILTTVREILEETVIFFRREGIMVGPADNLTWRSK
jgi:hypothetical protein